MSFIQSQVNTFTYISFSHFASSKGSPVRKHRFHNHSCLVFKITLVGEVMLCICKQNQQIISLFCRAHLSIPILYQQ